MMTFQNFRDEYFRDKHAHRLWEVVLVVDMFTYKELRNHSRLTLLNSNTDKDNG